MRDNFQYDVAFSFAGEQRDYVRKVFNYVESKGIKVFFDEAEQTEIWGKNLVDHFQKVFKDKAKFCVMFISREYKDKVWTNFERQVIQARNLIDEGYILPARIDSTEIEGLLSTISYIDLQDKTPEEFGEILINKLKEQKFAAKESPQLTFRQPKSQKTFNPYKVTQDWVSLIATELKRRCVETTSTSLEYFDFDNGGTKCIRILSSARTIYSLDIDLGDGSHDHGLSFNGSEGESSLGRGSHNGNASFEWDMSKEAVVAKLTNYNLLDQRNSRETYTSDEFIDALWDQVCDAIEQDTKRSNRLFTSY